MPPIHEYLQIEWKYNIRLDQAKGRNLLPYGDGHAVGAAKIADLDDYGQGERRCQAGGNFHVDLGEAGDGAGHRAGELYRGIHAADGHGHYGGLRQDLRGTPITTPSGVVAGVVRRLRYSRSR